MTDYWTKLSLEAIKTFKYILLELLSSQIYHPCWTFTNSLIVLVIFLSSILIFTHYCGLTSGLIVLNLIFITKHIFLHSHICIFWSPSIIWIPPNQLHKTLGSSVQRTKQQSTAHENCLRDDTIMVISTLDDLIILHLFPAFSMFMEVFTSHLRTFSLPSISGPSPAVFLVPSHSLSNNQMIFSVLFCLRVFF